MTRDEIAARLKARHEGGQVAVKLRFQAVPPDLVVFMEAIAKDVEALEAENARLTRELLAATDYTATLRVANETCYDVAQETRAECKELRALVRTLEAERDCRRARVVALVEFFWRCWDSARGLSLEPDGIDIQNWGAELGLLTKVTATEPCGDGCACAEWDDFPQDCYRPTIERDAIAGEDGGDAA